MSHTIVYIFYSFLSGDSGDKVGMSGAATQALATQTSVQPKSDSKYVKLNVGGTLYLSIIDTLYNQDTVQFPRLTDPSM